MGKNDQNWDNIGHFWMGNMEKFSCKIDQKSLDVQNWQEIVCVLRA